jgi:hypothetical protein
VLAHGACIFNENDIIKSFNGSSNQLWGERKTTSREAPVKDLDLAPDQTTVIEMGER